MLLSGQWDVTYSEAQEYFGLLARDHCYVLPSETAGYEQCQTAVASASVAAPDSRGGVQPHSEAAIPAEGIELYQYQILQCWRNPAGIEQDLLARCFRVRMIYQNLPH